MTTTPSSTPTPTRWRTTGKDLATIFDVGAVGLLSDSDLLARVAKGRGDASSELAFEVIVARHGPMVLGVCKRVLDNDDHAVADAFQATFLILARKGSTVRVDGSLGRWLHGVSIRVARRSRAVKRAERARLRTLEGVDLPARDRSGELELELRESIDEEIARLPARYRDAVVLCYLEGLTQEQAAHRLECPVGTIQSRLHRARERLRSGLSRRGLAPSAAWTLLTPSFEGLPGLASRTIAATSKISSGQALAGLVPIGVEALVHHTLRAMLMTKGSIAALLLMTITLSATGAGVLAQVSAQDPNPATATATATATSPAVVPPQAEAKPEAPSVADRLKQILAEHKAKEDAMRAAQANVKTQLEWSDLYTKMAPDDDAYSHRLVDLVMTSPEGPASRDALIWVVQRAGQCSPTEHGVAFAQAAVLLVRHHGDDPEAIRVGLDLDNLTSNSRDLLLTGFVASAKSRESKGLARLALGRYLAAKVQFVEGARQGDGQRRKEVYVGVIGDDGKPHDLEVDEIDEEYAYELQMRLCDPVAIKLEAERLLNEVAKDYGDVPYTNIRLRESEALLKQTTPTWNGKPMTEAEIKQLRALVSKERTLGQVALAKLDEIHNLAVGKPAPEIDGVDINGKPLKLSSYKGKVVVLVFWGSWCGPCMREVPREKEVVEKFKGKPFALLGINCKETKDAALQAIKAEGITWPNWHDEGDEAGPIASRYHIAHYPTMVVIDAEGIIRANGHLGEGLDQFVEELLNPTKTPEH